MKLKKKKKDSKLYHHLEHEQLMGRAGINRKASPVVSVMERKELSQQYEHAINFQESTLSQIPT